MYNRHYDTHRAMLARSVFVVAVCGLVALSQATIQTYDHTIHVSGTSPVATDNSSCWEGAFPCKTLSYALLGAMRNSTQVIIEEGEYDLDASTVFQWVYDLAIVGANSNETVQHSTGVPTVEVTCLPEAGLSFVHSQQITVENVLFSGCGALHNSTSQDFSMTSSFSFLEFQVGIYFLFCKDISFSHVTVSHSNGTGMVMYSTGGVNSFEFCNFSQNSIMEATYSGGGGLYVEFPYCIPGDLSCEHNPPDIPVKYSSDSFYHFTDCCFERNTAKMNGSQNATFVLPQGPNNLAFGRGGGLSFYFKGNATNNTILIESCRFSNNSAIWGAGLFAEFQDRAQNNNVTVVNSSLESNICNMTYKSAGGGTRIAYIFFDDEEVRDNLVFFHSCSFEGNTAYWGGGMSFLSARELTLETTNSLELTECEFIENMAIIGAAADLLVWHLTKRGMPARSTFTNCQFKRNSVESFKTTPDTNVGIAALNVDTIPVVFKESIIFEDNKGSALAAVATTINISDYTVANFTRNHGRYGGAISLEGYCYILVHPNSTLNFTNNTAAYLGGAIYSHAIAKHDFREGTQNCFVVYSDVVAPRDWTAHFYFENNMAADSPNSIYTTSVLSCEWWYDGRYNDVNLRYAKEVFCWNEATWVYINSNCSNQILTAPAAFVSPYDNKTFYRLYNMNAIPGKLTKLPVLTRDDRGTNTSNIMVLTARSVHGNLSIDASSVYISDNHIQLLGAAGSNGTFLLETLDPRVIYTEVNVTLQSCPPGLVPSGENNTSRCECGGNFGDLGYLQCSGTDFSSKLRRGIWVGHYTYNGQTQLVVGQCPYCSNYQHKKEEYLDLPEDPGDLDSYLCGQFERTGVLCGDCREGFGPAVNSIDECVHCSEKDAFVNWIYYILTEFLPITVFFFIVVIFNISITTGPANGFVFFAQVITTLFVIDSDGAIPLTHITDAATDLQSIYIIPYDIWNLRFFQPVLPKYCLSPHIDSAQMISLGYITAFYPLLLVAVFLVVLWLYDHNFKLAILICRPIHKCFYYLRRRWNLRTSLLDAFGTFLLLSYSKFSLVSVMLLNHTPLYNHKGFEVGNGVMYYAGNISYYSREFIPYFAVAMFVLATFVTVPPLILIAPSVTTALRKLGIRTWQPSQKFQSFLNVFHGCYKDGTKGTYDLRWFAGLYFVLRLLLFMICLSSFSQFAQCAWQQIVCSVIIFLFTLLQPYRINWYNTLDAFIFTILATVNACTIYNYYLVTVGQGLSHTAFTMQYILIFLPLIYMVIYALYQFWVTYKVYLKPAYRRAKRCFHSNAVDDKELIESAAAGDPKMDYDFLEYAHVVEADGRYTDRNTYRPSGPEAMSLLAKLDEERTKESDSLGYGSGSNQSDSNDKKDSTNQNDKKDSTNQNETD